MTKKLSAKILAVWDISLQCYEFIIFTAVKTDKWLSFAHYSDLCVTFAGYRVFQDL